ncbi:MATE family efflux transporter [Planctomycetales bacterium ZRK34]|nr:MATE family efflux transporter [Planctomycetales bacterium ZRK34]
MNRHEDQIDSTRSPSTPDLGAAPASAPPQRKPRRPAAGLPTHLSLPRQVWVLAMWPMLEQLMGSLVGFVDTTLAGHISEQATNGIGVASFATWLMGLLQGAVGVGSTAVIARAIGARHRREANSAVGQSMILAATWGIMIGFGFYFGAPVLASGFGLHSESHALCTLYLRLLSIAAPCMAILFIGASCLRGAGDFRSPFYVIVVVNIVNVVCSITLVSAPAPLGGYGLKGVAMGTVIAWIVGAALMVYYLLRGRGGVRLHRHRLGFNPSMMWRLIRIGGPSLIENGAVWFGHALVLAIVGRLGAEALIGSHHIAIRIEAFSFLPGFAFSLAAATMVGQYLGAQDTSMARRSAWACWAFASAIMVVFGAAFILIPQVFVRIVTDEPAFLNTVPQLLVIAGWAQIGFATSMVLSGAMRGAGDTRMTMLLNFFSTYAVRLPLVWLVGIHYDYGITGIWWVLSAELLFRGGIFLARFLQGGWAKVEV